MTWNRNYCCLIFIEFMQFVIEYLTKYYYSALGIFCVSERLESANTSSSLL